MSKREQTLLGLLLLTLVCVGIAFVYQSVYLPRYRAAQLKLTNAQQQVQTAKAVSQTQELILDEQAWLTSHEPEPISQQSAQSTLQKLCESMADRNKLLQKAESITAHVWTSQFQARSKTSITGFLLSTTQSSFNVSPSSGSTLAKVMTRSSKQR